MGGIDTVYIGSLCSLSSAPLKVAGNVRCVCQSLSQRSERVGFSSFFICAAVSGPHNDLSSFVVVSGPPNDFSSFITVSGPHSDF